MPDSLSLLRLMQLSDSALPIGATAHSYGLETLIAEGTLTVAGLERFLQEYLQEVGGVEAVLCRRGYQLAAQADLSQFDDEWLKLNQWLSALKLARESRAASAMLGRRLLQLALGLEAHATIQRALAVAKEARAEIHHSSAFGLVGGLLLKVEEELVVQAYLQQTLLGLISACQRLLPLGQSHASQLLWRLKPALLSASCQYEDLESINSFAPLVELGSMRHPTLTTRLFIS